MFRERNNACNERCQIDGLGRRFRKTAIRLALINPLVEHFFLSLPLEKDDIVAAEDQILNHILAKKSILPSADFYDLALTFSQNMINI
jgi:hypothetical protein